MTDPEAEVPVTEPASGTDLLGNIGEYFSVLCLSRQAGKLARLPGVCLGGVNVTEMFTALQIMSPQMSLGPSPVIGGICNEGLIARTGLY